MDSLTQIVLGAAVAEAVAGKELGIKAAFWGAIAGTIPDLDVFFRSLYNPLDAALVHRGFSHSLLFALITGPAFGWLFHRFAKTKLGLKRWTLLWFLSIVTHPILDMFTNYGTQFLWPFSPRITFNSVFVIDPLYTLPFLFFLIGALCMKRTSVRRRKWNRIGIIYSSLYLLWGVFVKLTILYQSESYFNEADIHPKKTMVTPMPLTSFYWALIAEDDSTVYVTYKSLFHTYNPKDVQRFPKEMPAGGFERLKKPTRDELNYITNGFFFSETHDDTLTVFDVRFGTALKITNLQNNQTLMGYQFVFDKKLNYSIEHYRNRRFDQIDIPAYFEFVFGKQGN